MATAFRLKTFPEILTTMFARSRSLLGADVDLNVGSVLRTILEAAALQDADQYVQISRLLDLFSIDTAQGDDLDRRALDFGADVFTGLRRRPANTSIAKISVGDGTLLVSTTISVDVLAGATTFTVVDGSLFPTSGAVALERGTERSETIVYTRVGNTFTVVYPTTGLASSHAIGGEVLRIATSSTLAADIAASATTVTLATGTGAAWPTSGNVILERNTVREELLAFTRVGDVLTVPPTTFAHAINTSAILSTNGSNRTINAGLICYVPATESSKQINFRVVTTGTLLDGDYTSDLIDVVSEDVGADTRVGSHSITRWASVPFANATVTNPIAAARGADRESDSAYRQRIRNFIQSLTRATPLSIETLVAGVTDPSTNASVAFVQIVEPVTPGASDLYITDGTSTFTLGQKVFLGRDVLIRDAETDDKRGRLGQYGPFGYSISAPVTPRLFRSVERGVGTSVGADYLEDTTQAMTPAAYVGMYLKTDDDQFYLITANTAIRFTISAGGATPSLGSYSVFDFASPPLTPGTDFQFNEATGDVELTTGLLKHDGLVAASDGASPSVGAYTYSTGLAAYVQRVVNGDPNDFDNFPGLRAAGTKVVVKAPTVITRTFTIKIVPARGFSDAQVSDSVKTSVQTYVNSQYRNILISEIIRRVKELPGIDDVALIDPVSNVTVPNGQIMRITADNVVIV